jgi:hypothetical protein
LASLATAATFREPWEAHIFCSLLRNEGIPASVAHEFHVWNVWPISTALGGVKVQVSAEQLSDARSIRSRSERGEFRAILQSEWDDLDDPHCPVCGSTNYWKRRSHLRAVFAILVSIFVALLPPKGWVCFCRNCGAKFKL